MIDFIPILTEYLQNFNFENGSENIQSLIFFFFKLTTLNNADNIEFFVKCGTLTYIFHYLNKPNLEFDLLHICVDLLGNMTYGSAFVIDVKFYFNLVFNYL